MARPLQSAHLFRRAEELIESDPLKRVDLTAPLFSEKTDELIGTVYVDDKPRINWRDKSREADPVVKWASEPRRPMNASRF
jgi:hypothetical protein